MTRLKPASNKSHERTLSACRSTGLPVGIEELRLAGRAKVTGVHKLDARLQKLECIEGFQIRRRPVGKAMNQTLRYAFVGDCRYEGLDDILAGWITTSSDRRADCRTHALRLGPEFAGHHLHTITDDVLSRASPSSMKDAHRFSLRIGDDHRHTISEVKQQRDLL